MELKDKFWNSKETKIANGCNKLDDESDTDEWIKKEKECEDKLKLIEVVMRDCDVQIS